MECISSEVVEERERRDRLGRRVKAREERERLLREYEASGLTQRAYCEREGINIHTFTSWRQGLRKGRKPEKPLSLFREVEVSGAERPRSLTLRLSNGMEAEGGAEELAKLISLLGGL